MDGVINLGVDHLGSAILPLGTGVWQFLFKGKCYVWTLWHGRHYDVDDLEGTLVMRGQQTTLGMTGSFSSFIFIVLGLVLNSGFWRGNILARYTCITHFGNFKFWKWLHVYRIWWLRLCGNFYFMVLKNRMYGLTNEQPIKNENNPIPCIANDSELSIIPPIFICKWLNDYPWKFVC